VTSLAQYDRVCAALAEASQVEDIIPLLDEFELAKVRAKQIKDHALLADATEFELRAERRLGEIIEAAKEAGLFRQGRQSKKKPEEDFLDRPTLTDAGIDRKLSQRAQARADMAPELFETLVTSTRERIAGSGAKTLETSDLNGARALMGSRIESSKSRDFFPTPPWATRALVEVVLGAELHSIWEPACGAGHMAEVLREYCPKVIASDIFDYGYGKAPVDFTKFSGPGADWIITNPPFKKLTEQFVLKAIELANIGVAMFVRLQWLESVGRYETIFKDHPPTCIAFFAERVPLCKGEWKPDGTTATAYIWLVWIKGQEPRPPFWIPPGQRERLTKPDDAERFTVHPVIRKGERIADDSGTNHQPESVHDSVDTGGRPPAKASVSEPASDHQPKAPHVPMADAGSPSFSESDLPEIILPGKWATFEHVAGFVDLTSEVAGRAS
jgi:methylase of polypeptide subunit release factors